VDVVFASSLDVELVVGAEAAGGTVAAEGAEELAVVALSVVGFSAAIAEFNKKAEQKHNAMRFIIKILL
jgi:hypothetical protein